MAEKGSVGFWIDEVLFSLKPRKTGMSQWLPAFAYKLPWEKIGWMPKLVKKYKDAEAIIRKKHNLHQLDSRLRGNGILKLAGLVLLVEALSIPAAWNPDLKFSARFCRWYRDADAGLQKAYVSFRDSRARVLHRFQRPSSRLRCRHG
jgi:hypothetical protein